MFLRVIRESFLKCVVWIQNWTNVLCFGRGFTLSSVWYAVFMVRAPSILTKRISSARVHFHGVNQSHEHNLVSLEPQHSAVVQVWCVLLSTRCGKDRVNLRGEQHRTFTNSRGQGTCQCSKCSSVAFAIDRFFLRILGLVLCLCFCFRKERVT